MPTLLSLSSQVARGHVGHSANCFVWQRLGFETIALPTVLLSNRPDYAHCAGERLSADRLDEMLVALESNGFLDGIDAIFTGYLPSAEHVALAARWISKLKTQQPDIVYCCDPIMGDEPDGLYIAEEAAVALRDQLLPQADIVTPNRFELGWLTKRAIVTPKDALEAARVLGCLVLATSTPCDGNGALANLAATSDEAWQAITMLRDAVPHGTGDLIAALFLAHFLIKRSAKEALALAAAGLETVIEASMGRDELMLIATQDAWANPTPWPVAPVPVTSR
jgi:pyridoxine kinase